MTKKSFTILAVACALLGQSIAHAEIIPRKGAVDPRIRTVTYDPMNVVQIPTYYGVSTHIRLGDDEVIRELAAGDNDAWKISASQNNIFLKPAQRQADTNLTVITNKRHYNFALMVQPNRGKGGWSRSNLIYALHFRYPEQMHGAQQQRNLKRELESARLRARNTDYWVAGSEEISPTGAFDDGRFIYLTFSENKDLPMVYEVAPDGSEALVNTNIKGGNTIVVQRMMPKMMLRHGKSVASVVNNSFDPRGGIDNTTGTVSSSVVRVIKGGEK